MFSINYRIGILDQSPVLKDQTNTEILQKTVQLAQKAEEWGYHRYWVSEHHNSDELLGSSPEVLVSYLLAKTKSIRIGSGGVMLQHYSPYKVAENFHVLATLEPGRTDLGIGKGPGGLPLSTKALQYGIKSDGTSFEEKILFLKQLLNNEVPDNHPLAGVQAVPLPSLPPELILLGASPNSAQLANQLGVTYAYALFLNSDEDALAEAVRIFRENNDKGRLIVALTVVAAERSEEAKKLASQKKLVKVHLESGRTITVGDNHSAEIIGQESGENYRIEEQKSFVIAGTALEVKEQLDLLYEKYEIDEFIINTVPTNDEARLRTFKLLSPNNIISFI